VRRGAILGERFRLEAPASAGGMGDVWRATDLDTKQPVAVKAMARFGPADHQRFDREAILLQALAHPGIVRYVAHGLHADTPYLVMEWLEGHTLAHALETHGLDAREALGVARQTAEALAHAHSFGVVHRDVKPSNLVLRGGDLARVVLIDFGVARPVGASYALTRTGEAIGTPGYMAPEQVRGHKSVDARADVFALGCLLYEALTGRRPFEGTHHLAVQVKILHWDPPEVRQLVPEIPPEVEALVAEMLAKDPAERPADGAAAAERLAALGAPKTGARRSRSAEPVTRIQDWDEPEAVVVAANVGEEDPDPTDPGVPGAEVCVDGSVVLVLSGGDAADLARRAAEAAATLRRSRPDAVVAVALGGIDRACDTAAREAMRVAAAGAIRLDTKAAEALPASQVRWLEGVPYLV
jgi:serine/threonine protein kinase